MPSWINSGYIRISTEDVVCRSLSDEALNLVLIDLSIRVVNSGRKIETSSLVYENFIS